MYKDHIYVLRGADKGALVQQVEGRQTHTHNPNIHKVDAERWGTQAHPSYRAWPTRDPVWKQQTEWGEGKEGVELRKNEVIKPTCSALSHL